MIFGLIDLFDFYFFIESFLSFLYIFAIIIVCFVIVSQENCGRMIILNEINGINIDNYELPFEFKQLKKIEKIELIFKNENMEKYIYKLKDIEINIIKEINDIRKQHNVRELKYNTNQKLPEFIMNEKTLLIKMNLKIISIMN